jgi:hypothetical protein
MNRTKFRETTIMDDQLNNRNTGEEASHLGEVSESATEDVALPADADVDTLQALEEMQGNQDNTTALPDGTVDYYGAVIPGAATQSGSLGQEHDPTS